MSVSDTRHRRRHADGHRPPAAGTTSQRRHATHPMVREIYKNAWLKRDVSSEKRGTPFGKKYEKFWVIFCIHDDADAFLEFYTEPKLGTVHKPLYAILLNSCLHVSPSLIGQANEYQFAVTLPNEVVRLVVSTWEQMYEWVESLQGKLREMNILCPKDNVYSKPPETKHQLHTRDPIRDPLPLPPTPIHPHIDVVRASMSSHSHHRDLIRPSAPTIGRMTLAAEPVSSVSFFGMSANFENQSVLHVNDNNPFESISSAQISEESVRSSSAASTSQATRSHRSSGASTHIFPKPVKNASRLNSTTSGPNDNEAKSKVSHPASTSKSLNSSTERKDAAYDDKNEDTVASNSSLSTSLDNNQSTNSTSVLLPSQFSGESLPSTSSTKRIGPFLPEPEESSNSQNGILNQRKYLRQQSAPSTHASNSNSSSGNLYETIYIDAPKLIHNETENLVTNSSKVKKASSVARSESCSSSSVRPTVAIQDSTQALRAKREPMESRSSSMSRLEATGESRIISLSSSCDSASLTSDSASSTSNGPPKVSNSHRRELSNKIIPSQSIESTLSLSDSQDPMEGIIDFHRGEYRIRRMPSNTCYSKASVPSNSSSENEALSHDVEAGDNVRTNLESICQVGQPIPLKEQQVMRLQAEINHAHGVRVVLRKKDCVGTMALVDYLGGVWIGGWKQQQNPVLYYAFHVGDQIIKVAGVTVQNSIEAHRAIKMVSSMQVEIVLRRLPCGKVFVLKRSVEGESLGIITTNNSGEIGEIKPDGLAAKYGVCEKDSSESNPNSSWYLTEINNRPVSLFAKETEVRDRLNAVGKEISILVQPSAFVKYLKKQLKAMKGHKDYIVG